MLVAVGDEAGLTFWGDSRCTRLPYDWVEGVIGKLQSYGSTNIATYCYNDSWGMIFIKGQTSPMAEGLESGSILPTAPVRLFTTFPLTISKPVVSISIENTGFGGDRYMLTVTNVVPGRDIEIQYSDRLPLSWKHLQTLNDPPTNFVQRSDLTMPNSSRFLRALMDASAHMPPGF